MVSKASKLDPNSGDTKHSYMSTSCPDSTIQPPEANMPSSLPTSFRGQEIPTGKPPSKKARV